MMIRIFTVLVLATSVASAFVVNNPSRATTTTRPAETELHGTVANRRNFLNQASWVVGGAVLFGAPQISFAKEEVEITPKNVEEAWKEMENELYDPRGGVAKMQKMIDDEDWGSLLNFTREYDQFLRNGKWARCRLFLPPILQGGAKITANTITFDLIGINQGARAKKERKEECNRYLNELRTDIGLALEYKARVVYPEQEL